MQQHGSKYFAHRPPSSTLGMGSVGHNSTFQNMVMLYIKLKRITNAATWLPADPLSPPPTLGSVGQNLTFSEHGFVAYQIKDNHECSNMVAKMLPTDPQEPGDGVSRSEFNFYQNMVMLHIKLKIIMKAATWLPADHPHTLGIGSVGQNSFSTEHGHVAYQIKGNNECSNMVANFASRPQIPPGP